MDFEWQWCINTGSLIVTNMPLWEGYLHGGSHASVGAGGVWEISIPSTQFCCELKPALKNKVN